MLETKHITKEFPGVKALTDVTFHVKKNEILALVGENGAGKSTLMKILSGVYPTGSFSGEIIFSGKKVKFENIKDAESTGISIIHQELNLIPELSVAENIYLGQLPTKGILKLIDFEKIYTDTKKILRELELNLEPNTPVGDLSIGIQQLVEIAKALAKDSQVIFFDEPTSSLSEKEVRNLLRLIKKLSKEKNKTIVYISHKLEEILEISDRITVLRDGKCINTLITKNTTKQEIITSMVGRELSALYPAKVEPKKNPQTSICVKNLNVWNLHTEKQILSDVSFQVQQGEVVGFAGIVGSGRTELFESIFGNSKYKTVGHIEVFGKFHDPQIPLSIDSNIGLVTEDRKGTGIHLHLSVLENATLARLSKFCRLGLIQKEQEEQEVLKFIQDLKIKTPNTEMLIGNLSGGNQQKVAIAKWLNINPKILILDEPTRGVDVGAKFEIYSILQDLCAKGVSIIVISSELPELIGLCHRAYVMKEGQIQGELHGPEMTEINFMKLAVS